MAKNGYIPDIRRNKILDLIKDKKVLTVSEITDLFDSSNATITRDLKLLESKGLVKRSYGGVSYIAEEPFYSFNESITRNVKEKAAIAKLAHSQLAENETMITNPGTTILELAKEIIKSNSNIFIITNSIKIINLYVKNNRRNIFCIGGDLNLECYGFTGQYANMLLSNINARYGIVGVHGIDPENGLTLAISGETQYVSELLKNVKEKIILADHTKFGKSSLYKIDVLLEDIDKVITDDKTDKKYIKALEEKGIEVLVADVGGK
jgi:DeoR/GlpR family transcriptional regulator of sugar metabolism